MKLKFKKPNPLMAALSVVIYLTFLNPLSGKLDGRTALENTATRMDFPSAVTDSQQLVIKRIYDSLERVRKWRMERMIPTINLSPDLLFVGLASIYECDTCAHPGEENKTNKYFLSFSGFDLHKNSSFYIEGNDYFIESSKGGEGENSGVGFTEKKKTAVRLAGTDDEMGLKLLIPVSRKTFKMIEVISYFIYIMAAIALLYFVVSFMRVLVNIAEGKPFIRENVKNLNQVGWALLITMLIVSIMPVLVPLIFNATIPSAVYYSWGFAIHKYRWGIILGITVLIIARSFKQGYKLQQGQDLTI